MAVGYIIPPMNAALPSPLAPPTVAAWCALLLGGWLLFAPMGWQGNEARATVIHPGPVVLHADEHGQFTAAGRINGIPAPLLVDTGAAEVVIPAPLAREAGLVLGEAQRYRSVNGTVSGWRTRIASLRIGSLHLRDVPATVLETGSDEVLLGMSALRHLTLVHRQGRLTLSAP